MYTFKQQQQQANIRKIGMKARKKFFKEIVSQALTSV